MAEIKVGDMVSWNSSGGKAEGKVEHIMREGVLGIPNSKFKINAEKDDPAVLIRIYRNGKETETLVGHKMSTLNKSEVAKHGSHDQSTHGRGKGGAGAGGGSNLTPAQDKQMNQLAIDMYNHKQSMPMSVRTGKNTPEAQAYRTRFSQIVDEAAAILGKSPQDAFGELNRRMGV